MHDALLVANALVSLASAVFCVVALVRPHSLLGADGGPVVPATRLYVWFYAVRQFPLSVAVVVALSADVHPVLPFLLAVAGVSQAGDAVLGVRHRNLRMTLGAAIAAVLHLGSAFWWLR